MICYSRVDVLIDVIATENDTLIQHPQEKKRISAIRVSLMEGGASGPFLGLSYDEEKPEDESFHVHGLTFIMDKSLLEQCGSINIDFIEAGNNSGFKITTANPIFLQNSTYNSVAYGPQGLCH